VSWEPRALPISLALPVDALKATTDEGDVLELTTERDVLSAQTQAEISSVEIDVPLPPADRSATSIKELTGVLRATLPGRTETFVFERIGQARSVEQKRAGVTVTLDRVGKTSEVYAVRVTIAFDDASGALESYRGWIMGNEAFVTKGDERRDPLTLELTRQETNLVGVAYIFDLGDEPDAFSFHYVTPASIVPREVKFTLKDIPLP